MLGISGSTAGRTMTMTRTLSTEDLRQAHEMLDQEVAAMAEIQRSLLPHGPQGESPPICAHGRRPAPTHPSPLTTEIT